MQETDDFVDDVKIILFEHYEKEKTIFVNPSNKEFSQFKLFIHRNTEHNYIAGLAEKKLQISKYSLFNRTGDVSLNPKYFPIRNISYVSMVPKNKLDDSTKSMKNISFRNVLVSSSSCDQNERIIPHISFENQDQIMIEFCHVLFGDDKTKSVFLKYTQKLLSVDLRLSLKKVSKIFFYEGLHMLSISF